MSQREYAEDTVFWSLKAAEQFSARRRTTVLYVAGAVPEDPELSLKGSAAEHGPGDFGARKKVLTDPVSGHTATEFVWIDNTPDLWAGLRAVLEEARPKRIAVNAAEELAFSSGMHAGELALIRRELGPHWAARLTADVPLLPVELVATMVPTRLDWYRRLQETAWALISEAFSARVITPGTTTTADVEWWMRERLQAQNLTTWFHPSVTVLASSSSENGVVGAGNAGPAAVGNAIQYGDLLHVDFGITALGLNTDTQHLGYVVPPNSRTAAASSSSSSYSLLVPQGLRDGLACANRLQDIVRAAMTASIGRSGNEVLHDCRAAMAAQKLQGKVYSHPIGDWGHAAGTLIGMTNLQDGVPVLGDLPLLPSMYYSIELLAEHFVPELNRTVVFPLEEDVYWDNETASWEWLYGRQEHFHLVISARGEKTMDEL